MALFKNSTFFLFIVFLILGSSCTGDHGSAVITRKVLVLGFDGMDPVLLENYMAEGILPNFALLREKGDFKRLTTSMPPQSPVAWSSFITGMNPGGHGIFDFIARDPETYLPYLSTSRSKEAGRSFKIGDWLIPFSKAETFLLRKGKAFWEILEDNDIPATVIKMPANFPPVESRAKTLSGMGTPDILGTYGTFAFYTTKDVDEAVESGRVFKVKMKNNTVQTELSGPPNPFRQNRRAVRQELTIKTDPESPVALIRVQDTEIILKEGEWSNWVRVEFKLAPFKTLSGICRFFLISTNPDFELYVSPINIDPLNPALSISTPEEYSAEIADEIGYFYTQGMPEDTKALDGGVLQDDDFLEQSDSILKERIEMLEMELSRFDSGLLFVYFSTTDPVQHMFWRYIDREHPFHNPEEASEYSDVIKKTYEKADAVLGNVMKKIDSKTVLIVVSDHGFGSFRRHFHLNSWLKQNGYIVFKDKSLKESGEFFRNVNFKETKAYALGFNGIYINLRSREGMGIVSEGREKEELMGRLIKGLEGVRDPENEKKVINKVYRREEIYSGRYVKDAPDLIIGYNRGYRASWETALGKIPDGLLGDNMKKWSGTHLWDYRLVPGIVLSNKKITKKEPFLYDIAPTVLSEFGIRAGKEMNGKPIF